MTAKPAENKDTNRSTDPREARAQKLESLKSKGINAYPHEFRRANRAQDVQDKYADLESGAETEDSVTLAGRIMAMRNNGMFIDLMDASGRIQLFCHKDSSPQDVLDLLPDLDLGDLVGATGLVRRTPRGELSVRVKELTLLHKTMSPLPEKYHGLADIEQRYRQRYVDLIVNEGSRTRLRQRSQILAGIRRYMAEKHNALEVETPLLHPIMGGASAKPFVTHHNALDTDFFLRVAPELYLKRLLVGGLADAVFEIGRNFRNEGISPKHNPEFTMIEGYHAYADYTDMMDLVEELVQQLVQELHGSLEIEWGDRTIDFSGPWPRKTMCEAVEDATGIDFLTIETAEDAHKAAKKAGVSLDPKANWGQVVEEVFAEKVEPAIVNPIHITDFPLEISPLAKTHRDNPRLVERFETFINGWEIANAFTELNDPAVQRERFMGQVAQRDAGDEEAQMLDEDYITALEYGLPPTGGWGMGIDRLVMLLTNAQNIRDVIAFPTLKPKG